MALNMFEESLVYSYGCLFETNNILGGFPAAWESSAMPRHGVDCWTKAILVLMDALSNACPKSP